MIKLIKCLLVAAAFSFVVVSACATQSVEESAPESADGNESPSTQIYQGSGMVKAVDTEKKQVTIDHREIPGLMSAMTMDFSVSDPELLTGIGAGDSVDFELERKGSDLTVTKILKKENKEISLGRSIYKTNCAECHGDNGAGTEKGISFLKGHALDHPREDFIRRVKEGKEDEMPSFKDKLNDEEINAVVTFVRDVLQKDAAKGDGEKHVH